MWNEKEVLIDAEDIKNAPAKFLTDTLNMQICMDAIANIPAEERAWLDELRRIEGLGFFHHELSKEEHEQLQTLYAGLREKMKDVHIPNISFDGGPHLKTMVSHMEQDFSSLEERLAAFAADSQLWDDRVLGADEQYVELCSDPEVAQIAHQIAQERSKEEKRVVVLGAGPRRVGTLTGAIIASLQSKHGGTYFDMETVGVDTIKTDKPSNFDYNQGKLRKGKGHHKFKKGKKK